VGISAFPFSVVSGSKVPAIPKKFILKEAQNLILEVTILKQYLVAMPFPLCLTQNWLEGKARRKLGIHDVHTNDTSVMVR